MAEKARHLYTGPLNADGGVKEGAKPFLIELGLLILAWNDMQEALGELYGAVIADAKIETWRQLRDDRRQRKLLREAVNQLKAVDGKADVDAIKRSWSSSPS